MSLAFLKLLLSARHCRLVRDMVSVAIIYLYTAGTGGENLNGTSNLTKSSVPLGKLNPAN